MKLNYTVHSITREPVQVTADLDGRKVTAAISGCVLELVREDGSQSHTFRFVPESDEAMAKVFKDFAVGRPVALELKPVKE